ncbi:MAG: hypothetical protein ACXABY_02390 [Candidatus Thorarchaeota archaeon]|jgi:hypothetical protein
MSVITRGLGSSNLPTRGLGGAGAAPAPTPPDGQFPLQDWSATDPAPGALTMEKRRRFDDDEVLVLRV